MIPINQSLYVNLRVPNIDKILLYNILLNETFRWSQNFKNWCIRRDLINVYNTIFTDDTYKDIKYVSKKLYDFCISEQKCCICGNAAKYRNFKQGYDKTCSYSCAMKLNSKQRIGNNNPYFRTPIETRKRVNREQSIRMKEKILNGEFTPCITNSWANSRVKIKLEESNIFFRSTWEAMFWLLNNKFEYEKIRIPYIKKDGTPSIYIVDFVDKVTKTLYEIKPSVLKHKDNNVLKTNSALKWCTKNGYNYIIISEDYFIENSIKIRNLTNNIKILKQLGSLCK
jgi:hypothetical protein